MFPKDSNFSNQLAEVSTPLYIQNKYISDPNLQKVKVHLTNEGTLDYQTELEATCYTISLLNPIRRDVGVQEYQITEQSLNDSTKIAEQYVRDNWTIFNKHAHDMLALLNNNADGESISQGFLTFENGETTLDDLHRGIYESIVDMIFNDRYQSWGHMTDLVGMRGSLNAVYLGVQADKMGQIHFNGNDVKKENTVTYIYINGKKYSILTHPDKSARIPLNATDSGTSEEVQYQQNYGHLDSYGLTNQGLHVLGWHAAGASETETNGYLIVLANGKEVARVHINPVIRSDVEQAYPNVYGSENSGFDQVISIPNSAYGQDLTIVARYSDDSLNGEGNRVDYWYPVIKGDASNNGNLDGVQFNNGKLNVTGWHATNQAVGKKYHVIIAYDQTQNRELSRTSVTPVTRNDVQAAYPNVLNADQSGFNVSFSLKPEFSTDEIQFVSRYSSDPACNSDYVDYWFPAKRLISDQSNQACLDNVSLNGNQLHVAGWHATNASMGRPYHSIIILNASTGQELGRSTTSAVVNRPDLVRVFPNVMTAGQNGFNTNITLAAGMVDQPIRIISRWSATEDANENYVDYWFQPQSIVNNDEGDYANLDNFSLQNNQLHVTGWNATNKALGCPYHYIILYDQTANHEISRQEIAVNNSRPDVSAAYPQVINAGESGFDTTFDYGDSLNGHQLVILSRWTNDPVGNGNAVDYWFAQTTFEDNNDDHNSNNYDTNYADPNNHNVKKAYSIDSFVLYVENYENEGTGKTEHHRLLDVTGWMISNYRANFNYASWRDQIWNNADNNAKQESRFPQVLISINGKVQDNPGWQPITDGIWMGMIDRPDVAAKYPDVWDSENSGFDAQFIVDNLKATDDVQFVFRIWADSKTRNTGSDKPSDYKYDDMVSKVYHFDPSMWNNAKNW